MQKQFTFDSEALEQSCKLSQTDWDVHIRQLTAEHESTLSDFVSVGLVPEAQLDFVLEQLDERQCSALREEFRGAASRRDRTKGRSPPGYLAINRTTLIPQLG